VKTKVAVKRNGWNKVPDNGGLVVGGEINIYVEVELTRKR